MIDINELLGRISFPETPEERDEACDEVAVKLKRVEVLVADITVTALLLLAYVS